MLKASNIEYELMKKELTNLKVSINTFLGYIIGANGVIFIILAILPLMQNNNDNFLIQYGLLYISLVSLFLLYNIIRYKFNSYNKLAGAIRLLTQEVDYKYIDIERAKKPNNHIAITNSLGTLLSWEYIMAKWDSTVKSKKCPANQLDKLDFEFSKPFSHEKKAAITDNENKINFLCHLIYGNNRIIGRFRDVFYKYRLIQESNDVYRKYKMDSWKYPRNVFNTFLTLYLLISIVFSLLSFYSIDFLEYTTFIKILLTSLWFVPSLVFFYYFYFDLQRVLRKDKSSDFYCWAFLPSRVQQLNQNNIRPTFFSTFNIRYNKSLRYFEKLKDYIKEYPPDKFAKVIKDELDKKSGFYRYVLDSNGLDQLFKIHIKKDRRRIERIRNLLYRGKRIESLESFINKEEFLPTIKCKLDSGKKLNNLETISIKYIRYIDVKRIDNEKLNVCQHALKIMRAKK